MEEKTSWPRLIGVAGPSGSGKTTVVDTIIQEVSKEYCDRVPNDMFYRREIGDLSVEERENFDYDDPDALSRFDFHHACASLKDGHEILIPEWDFGNHKQKGPKIIPVKAKPFILVEGIMALKFPEIRELLSRALFVQEDLDTCFDRRLERDMKPVSEGGRGRSLASVRAQWPKVKRAYLLHFASTIQFADLIIPEGGHNDKGISTIVGWMKHELDKKMNENKRKHRKK